MEYGPTSLKDCDSGGVYTMSLENNLQKLQLND
jgi:hypothetical protein